MVEGLPDGGRIHDLVGQSSAFTPDEFYEIATRLTQAAHQRDGSL